MKTNKLFVAFATILTVVVMASCSMMKDLEWEVKPDPIEMHGDEIAVNINGKFIKRL